MLTHICYWFTSDSHSPQQKALCSFTLCTLSHKHTHLHTLHERTMNVLSSLYMAVYVIDERNVVWDGCRQWDKTASDSYCTPVGVSVQFTFAKICTVTCAFYASVDGAAGSHAARKLMVYIQQQCTCSEEDRQAVYLVSGKLEDLQ